MTDMLAHSDVASLNLAPDRPRANRNNTEFRGVVGAGAVLLATACLGACTSLGGNVQGNFSCRAPGGICAPTSTIDDAALALIGGEENIAPVGSYTEPSSGAPRMIRTAAAEPARSGEKVLRIVFPSHIDRAGRFHETAAIRAVVERAGWTTASAAPAQATRVSAATLESAEQGYPDSTIRTLSELAWAAPEVRFPDPVAAVDPQIAAEAEITASTRKVALAPGAKPATRSRGSASSSGHIQGVATAAAPAVPSGPMIGALTYSLPPLATGPASNPIETIRAQVARRLKPAVALATGPSAAAPASDTSRPGGSTDQPTGEHAANRPSILPVSGVNP